MHKDLIERVAQAISPDAWSEFGVGNMGTATVKMWRDGVRQQARRAIDAYEAAKQEAQDAEDERLYTEFHK